MLSIHKPHQTLPPAPVEVPPVVQVEPGDLAVGTVVVAVLGAANSLADDTAGISYLRIMKNS